MFWPRGTQSLRGHQKSSSILTIHLRFFPDQRNIFFNACLQPLRHGQTLEPNHLQRGQHVDRQPLQQGLQHLQLRLECGVDCVQSERKQNWHQSWEANKGRLIVDRWLNDITSMVRALNENAYITMKTSKKIRIDHKTTTFCSFLFVTSITYK